MIIEAIIDVVSLVYVAKKALSAISINCSNNCLNIDINPPKINSNVQNSDVFDIVQNDLTDKWHMHGIARKRATFD